MFPFVDCVVRIRETSLPPLDDPFHDQFIVWTTWCLVSSCRPMMWAATAVL